MKKVLWITGALLAIPAYAQVSSGVVDLFFKECDKCVEISRVNDKGVYEYGYKRDYGSWYEETYYFGKDVDTAKEVMVSDIVL